MVGGPIRHLLIQITGGENDRPCGRKQGLQIEKGILRGVGDGFQANA
jgi:hypothetical protein